MVICGDCLIEFKKIKTKSVDLIYLDPPFFTQKKQSLKTRDNSKKYSFDDKWESILEYTLYIKKRLLECERVLKDTGSIFLHCDRSASHYLRIALDDVFGNKNFQSEIVWTYKRWSNAKKGLLNCHQIIYFYSKTENFKFKHIYENYSPTTNIDQIFQKRVRNENGKTAYKKLRNGDYELMEAKKGVPLSDVWEIPYLNPKAKERTGYPTQKPVILLEKVIRLTTDQGDLVVDPFCGSGSTLVAAKLMKRRYLGIDISEDAIKLSKQRLENPIKSDSYLLKNGKNSYCNQDDEITKVLSKIDAVSVQRNRGIDGFLRIQGDMRPIPVRIQRDHETLQIAMGYLLKASKKNKYQIKILIKTNNAQESTLFDSHNSNVDRHLIIIEDLEDFQKNKQNYVPI